jgi:predicted alpha/beta superfamily hydrolase
LSSWFDYVEYHHAGAEAAADPQTSSPVFVREPSVVGRVRIWPGFHSDRLGNTRDLLVYLPPSHGQPGRRFPVIYMHDGQNLFDAMTSFAGEWQVDETMQALAADGLEAIIVGLPNAGPARFDEYSPYRVPRLGGGRADLYLDFLLQEVKPAIDRDFATRPDPQYTGILGSSMGALVSLYGFFRRPGAFGLAGALSPALWVGGKAILGEIERSPKVDGRVYIDTGELERSRRRHATGNLVMRSDVGALAEILRQKGYRDGIDLLHVEDEHGHHNEADWARRLPAALRFLLA